MVCMCVFFKQKTAYEMRISDWSSDVCSSDLLGISLGEISQEFGISHRTAQRMTSALEDNFANVVVVEDDDRRRRWRIQSPIPERLQPRQENTIEIGRASCRESGVSTCRSRWSPYH